MLTWIHGIQRECISCWIAEKKHEEKKREGLLRPTEFVFSVCPLGWWNDGQGGTSRTCQFELTNGGENLQTHFAHHRLGERLDQNCGREILLQGTPQRSRPKSIVEPGTRVGIRLGIGTGKVNILCQNCITHTCTN